MPMAVNRGRRTTDDHAWRQEYRRKERKGKETWKGNWTRGKERREIKKRREHLGRNITFDLTSNQKIVRCAKQTRTNFFSFFLRSSLIFFLSHSKYIFLLSFFFFIFYHSKTASASKRKSMQSRLSLFVHFRRVSKAKNCDRDQRGTLIDRMNKCTVISFFFFFPSLFPTNGKF